MRTRKQMDIDSRLRYYEAFVSVRDVMRAVETACGSLSGRHERSETERTCYRIEQLKWQCALAVHEAKRRSYDANTDAVCTPWLMELRAIKLLALEAKNVDFESVTLDDLRHLATESAQFFSRLHP